MTVVTARLQVSMAVSAPSRPEMMESRRMGKLRKRSKSPPWRSSAMPVDGTHAREQDTGHHETGNEEVHVGEGPRVADRPAEHVAEDEEEQRPLRGPGDDQLGRADELLHRAGRHFVAATRKEAPALSTGGAPVRCRSPAWLTGSGWPDVVRWWRWRWSCDVLLVCRFAPGCRRAGRADAWWS